MRNRFPLTVSLSNDVVNELDSLRGLISRSAYIEKILLEAIKREKQNE